jgi:hypothetical protein
MIYSEDMQFLSSRRYLNATPRRLKKPLAGSIYNSAFA